MPRLTPDWSWLRVAVRAAGLLAGKWFAGSDSLSSDELSLVGTWRIEGLASEDGKNDLVSICVFEKDRTWSSYVFVGYPPHQYGAYGSGKWVLAERMLVLWYGERGYEEMWIDSLEEKKCVVSQGPQRFEMLRGAGEYDYYLASLRADVSGGSGR